MRLLSLRLLLAIRQLQPQTRMWSMEKALSLSLAGLKLALTEEATTMLDEAISTAVVDVAGLMPAAPEVMAVAAALGAKTVAEVDYLAVEAHLRQSMFE